MTARIATAACAAAGPDVEIIAREPEQGPDAIEGPFDAALSVPGLLKALLAAERDGADAHVIACADDSGLDAARAACARPVIGIGEAAFHAVSLVAHSFCVVTTLARSAPIIEDNIRRYGFGHRCRRVFATDIPVLELEDPKRDAFERISDFIRQGRSLGAEGVVLGCAGMSEFARRLQSAHGIPVVEGVGVAVGLAQTLVRSGLMTSKAGVWALPSRLAALDQVVLS
jgi:allantoin racemase